MPNTKSSSKDLRQKKKRTQRNSRTKNNLKTLFKKIDKALNGSDQNKVLELTKKFQSLVDKAVKTKIIKKNSAARKKSRLFQALRKNEKKA